MLRRRVRISNEQLADAKVSSPIFPAKLRKFMRHFKGLFAFGNVEVRSLRGQPATHSTGESGYVIVEIAVFHRPFVRLSRFSGLRKTATLERICRKSPTQTTEIPVFVETIGGDWFDHH